MNILNQMNQAIKNLPQTLETTFIGEILFLYLILSYQYLSFNVCHKYRPVEYCIDGSFPVLDMLCSFIYLILLFNFVLLVVLPYKQKQEAWVYTGCFVNASLIMIILS